MNRDNFPNSVMPLVIRSIRASISKGLKNIYVVGSVSSNEVTVIYDECSGKIYASDIELIIDVGMSTFMTCCVKSVAKKLSQKLTKILESRGFKTHVSISITSFALSRFIPPIEPNSIYLYELRRVMLESGSFTIFHTDSHVRPTKLDSLNLVFSSAADYVFVKSNLFESLTIYEKCYIIAKRCLTLLYSLLLFNGIYPKSYISRITLAKKHSRKLFNVLSYSDIEVLEALARYKLSGDSVILAERLPTDSHDINSTLGFLERYFEELAKKVLMYELANYVKTKDMSKLRKLPDNLAILLGEYKSKIEVPFHKRIMYLIAHMTLMMVCPKERDWRKIKIISYSLLKKGLKIEDVLRYLMTLTFLLIVSGRGKNKMKSVDDIKSMWNLFMM